jgi:GNAT superfamily N-acetyltransferase
VISIPDAVEVFVRGFCFLRSSTRPYVAERLGHLWLLRDAPPAPRAGKPATVRRDPRKAEVIAYDTAPARVVAAIRDADPGWHFVCHLHEPDVLTRSIRDAYKALGYRALATEWMFAHDLGAIPALGSEPPVRRVRTEEEAERLRTLSRRRQIRPQDLAADAAPQRLYAAMDVREVYGWVSSVPVRQHAWVANLYVPAQHRGKGFGRALMSALLADDLAHGVDASVLLASTDGARLYPHLGYRQLGVLQIFCPVRRRA